MLLLALVVRLDRLSNALHVDERVTYIEFVSREWSVALAAYPFPNNHLFHTALAKLSTGVFGYSDLALRVPALLAGLLLVPASYAMIRMAYGRPAALIAAAFVATSAELVAYSALARGYSLVSLLFVGTLIVALRLRAAPSRQGWLIIAVLAALGLWTIPVMLFPLGTVAAWFAAVCIVDRRLDQMMRLVLAATVTAAITVLLYLPVLQRDGLAALTQNEFVTPTGWTSFLAEAAQQSAATWRNWTRNLPAVVEVAFAACATLGVVVHRRFSRVGVGIPHAAVLWIFVVLLANHRMPPARVWQWLIPLFAALAGIGATWLLERLRQPLRATERQTAILAVGIGFINTAAQLLAGRA